MSENPIRAVRWHTEFVNGDSCNRVALVQEDGAGRFQYLSFEYPLELKSMACTKTRDDGTQIDERDHWKPLVCTVDEAALMFRSTGWRCDDHVRAFLKAAVDQCAPADIDMGLNDIEDLL